MSGFGPPSQRPWLSVFFLPLAVQSEGWSVCLWCSIHLLMRRDWSGKGSKSQLIIISESTHRGPVIMKQVVRSVQQVRRVGRPASIVMKTIWVWCCLSCQSWLNSSPFRIRVIEPHGTEAGPLGHRVHTDHWEPIYIPSETLAHMMLFEAEQGFLLMLCQHSPKITEAHFRNILLFEKHFGMTSTLLLKVQYR